MKNYIGRNTIIEDGAIIHDDVFIGHNCVIRKGSVICKGVVIGHNTVIEENVSIGASTRIQAMCYITKNTVIEDCVFIGPMVCTTNDERIASHGRKLNGFLKGPWIKYGARIGARVLLLPGVVIGRNAFIGAGTIVIHDVPERELQFMVHTVRTKLVPEEELI